MDYSELRREEYQEVEALPTPFLEHVGLIIDQLSQEMEQTCDNCNTDRLTCSFSPLCHNRWWLDLLIESGISKKLFPQFCYERRGKEIERFVKRKGTLVEVEDARFLLNDFLEVLGLRNLVEEVAPQEEVIKSVVDFHRKFWKTVRPVKYEGQLFLLLNGFEAISRIDFQKKMVSVNLHNGTIDTKDTLVNLLEQCGEIVNCPLHTFQTPSALYLQLKLPHLSTDEAAELSTKVETFVPYSQVIDDEPGLVVGLTTNPESPSLTFDSIKSVFSLVSQALTEKEGKTPEK